MVTNPGKIAIDNVVADPHLMALDAGLGCAQCRRVVDPNPTKTLEVLKRYRRVELIERLLEVDLQSGKGVEKVLSVRG